MNNILMNTEMTKAILDGRKVQTRRVVKGNKVVDFRNIKIYEKLYPNGRLIEYKFLDEKCSLFEDRFIERYAKYKVGETMLVREPAKVLSLNLGNVIEAEYLADGKKCIVNVERFKNNKKGISIYPSWIDNLQGIPNGCIKEMARIFLKITNIRVERLQDISNEDCYREGVEKPIFPDILHEWKGSKYKNPQTIFRFIYNEVAPKGYMWEDNPCVFVYEFEIVKNK